VTSTIWPLFDLRVSTPRLSLRYVTDDLAERLAELAARGIHDPATMPFSEPWTDVEPPELQRNTVRYYWWCRAETTSQRWMLTLAVLDREEQPIGFCSIAAEQFARSRTAATGSWIGREHQRRGFGREMRQAALHLVFAGLGGAHATTGAWHDNAASLAVTRSLPYEEGEAIRESRRGVPDTMLTFSMSRDRWRAVRRNDIELGGIEATRDFLELEPLPSAA